MPHPSAEAPTRAETDPASILEAGAPSKFLERAFDDLDVHRHGTGDARDLANEVSVTCGIAHEEFDVPRQATSKPRTSKAPHKLQVPTRTAGQ
jgi:hypothetical protein